MSCMDFWDINKPYERTVVLQAPDWGRPRMTAFDEPPPESDPSLLCQDSDWQDFIKTEEMNLCRQAGESCHGTSEVEAATVVRSDVEGIEGRSEVTRTIVANDLNEDQVDLQEMYNFDQKEASYKLPIIEQKERILSTVNGNQIVIISGETGCGKTTQVPQYILDQHAMERKMVNIIVTQPRKIAASSVARRVCEERGWKVGGLVGYQVGLDRANKSPDTRLLYVTTGILKKIIIAQKNLNSYTHIILDEVHEREEDMDLVMLICKKLLFTNSRGTKLILMSATLDEEHLKDYFTSHIPGVGDIPPPAIQVDTKKRGEVPVFYYDQLQKFLKIPPCSEDLEFEIDRPSLHFNCIYLCKYILQSLEKLERKENHEAGAVLVFLPGIHEIQVVRDYLMEDDQLTQLKKFDWWCIPLHSSVSWEEQKTIYNTPPPNTRKIILSTNIAESSLTIPDIQYVIDFCLTKNVQTDPDTHYASLQLDWASKDQLTQRIGRAGRVSRNGSRAFRLISRSLEDKLLKSGVPEMLRVPLTKVVLDVKMLNMGSPKQLLALAMDPPEIQSLQKTIIELKEMGALLTTVEGLNVRDDGDLTVLGEIMAKLPLDVKLGKMIVLGHIFGILEEAIIIAAGLNGKSIFTAPFDRRVQAYKNKLFWAHRNFSDCFAILHAYQTWETRRARGEFKGKDGLKREQQFCETSFLQRKSLVEMSMLVEDITRSLRKINIEPLQIQNPVKWLVNDKLGRGTMLRLIMFGAFYPNYFAKSVSSEAEANAHKVLGGRDPKSTVYLQGMDENHSEFGAIYAGQIKNMFQDCTKDEEKINLTFDGRKIFVEFARSPGDSDRVDRGDTDSNGNMTGDIIHQVYVGVKLRNHVHNQKLKLKLYGTVDIAKAKHEEWKEILRRIKEQKELTSNEIGQVPPPGLDVTCLDIDKVTHISSPSMFWIQTRDRVQDDERLVEIIDQVLRSCVQVTDHQDVRVGNVYLAPYKEEDDEESHYYRARVHHVTSTKSITVFFIDYGNMAQVDVRDLRVITSEVIKEFSDLVTIPGLALECRLANIKPNKLRNSKGLWDQEVIDHFKELVFGHAGGRISSRIFSVTKSGSGHSQFVVSLHALTVRHPGDETVDVNRRLISCPDERGRLADEARESYTSEKDHRDRERFTAYTSAMQMHLQAPYISAAAPAPKSMEEDSKLQPITVTLQGPFSPLEHKVQAVYRTGLQKLAIVDPESVNAVLLNQAPSDKQEQWMVAGQVMMSPSGGSLMLRNTTWMPDNPGFGSLATMIFAPQVELRTDAHRNNNTKITKITGFIAGLGAKTIWDKPWENVTKSERTHAYYPEHDLEVKLDVSLNNGDINYLNKIRYWLNQMLLRTEDGTMMMTQPKKLDEAQKALKSYLEELLMKSRRSTNPEGVPCGHEYRWGMIRKSLRLKSQASNEAYESKCVFKMIDGVQMQPSKESEVAMEKLIRLYALWDVMDDKPLAYSEVCPVCPGQLALASPRDIHYHLHSEQHQAEESLVVDCPDTVASTSTGYTVPSSNVPKTRK